MKNNIVLFVGLQMLACSGLFAAEEAKDNQGTSLLEVIMDSQKSDSNKQQAITRIESCFFNDFAHISDEYGQTLLMLAVGFQDKELVAAILKKNPSAAFMNKRSQFGVSALSLALHTSNIDITEMLLRQGKIDTNQPFSTKDEFGNTYLMYISYNPSIAPFANKMRMIQLLLKYGADVNFRNTKGATLLIALCEDSPDTEESADFIGELVQLYHVNLEAKMKTYHTALWFAVQKGKINLVKKLVELGANVNCQTMMQKGLGNTPLMKAVSSIKGSGDIWEQIALYLAGDLNVKFEISNYVGGTALSIAKGDSRTNIVQTIERSMRMQKDACMMIDLKIGELFEYPSINLQELLSSAPLFYSAQQVATKIQEKPSYVFENLQDLETLLSYAV